MKVEEERALEEENGSGVPLFLRHFSFHATDGRLEKESNEMLVGALGLSVPLVFGALGGVISERVGVVNIAIEGQFLAGALTSAMIASTCSCNAGRSFGK